MLRVVVAILLSVASSFHACRSRVGRVCARGRTGVRGGDHCVGESPRAYF